MFNDLGRPVFIHICKDGTISFRARHQPVFNGRALPVFSVNSFTEAEQLQVRFGSLQLGEHPQMPGLPWYRWTGFEGSIAYLDKVTEACREWYAQEMKRKEAART